MKEYKHTTVLLNEAIDALNVEKGKIYADFTLGGGGHTSLILERGGTVIGIDRDMDAINSCKERFKDYKDRFFPVHSNYARIKKILEEKSLKGLDGIVVDLGVSSFQLDEESRGFSYMNDAPLDMRMDREDTLTAKDVVNNYSVKELENIIFSYGEERWAKRIAEFIEKSRKEKRIETTGELVEIIKSAIPKDARRDGPHPAKRTFQAIRIEVNKELELLSDAIKDALLSLNDKGRISVITFHSLEDRIVKNVFSALAKGCECPKELPICVCGKKEEIKIITKKPIIPTEEEIKNNPRSRSAKLRVAERKGNHVH